jgi:RNA polymerase sigma factor for flagellar operon FliA
MRAEALALMKDGMNSQLEPDLVIEQRPDGRVAKRKAAYYDTVSKSSDFRSRLDSDGAARNRLLDLGRCRTA